MMGGGMMGGRRAGGGGMGMGGMALGAGAGMLGGMAIGNMISDVSVNQVGSMELMNLRVNTTPTWTATMMEEAATLTEEETLAASELYERKFQDATCI